MTMDLIQHILASLTFEPTPQEIALVVRCLFIFVIVITACKLIGWLFKFLCWTLTLFEPLNHELDMTVREHCKRLAEVDNSLKFQTLHQRTMKHSNNTQSLGEQEVRPLVDCATGLLGGANSVNDQHAHSAASNQSRSSDGSNQHVYPNGWLPVMESSKVKPGTMERGILMGRDIIVTRSIGGEVSVLDAYCPHMGVHIGVGGKVLQVNKESCVQCPFHGWTFRASDGQCVSIPYLKGGPKCSSGIPKQAKLNTWLCDEVDNFIYIWHHIDNQPPSWRFEPTPELYLDNWILMGRSCHKTNLDIRDMHENGADMNHFEGIHNDLFVFGGKYLVVQAYNKFQKYTRHHWEPSWKPVVSEDGKTSHVAEMSLTSWISFFKFRCFYISLTANQVGPACVVLKYDSACYGRGVLKMNAIPIGGRRTLYVQHIYTENTYFNRFMAKWVLFGEIRQLERDLFIWNHKKNIKAPIFVPEDRVLKQFRMWYSQFFKRKRSVTIEDNRVIPLKHSAALSENNNLEF